MLIGPHGIPMPGEIDDPYDGPDERGPRRRGNIHDGRPVEVRRWDGAQTHRLLQPLGYNWFIKYQTPFANLNGSTYGKPQIRVFKIGDGPRKKLYHQLPGNVLNLNETNVSTYRISRAIGDSINEVQVTGGMEKAEVTLELFKTWPEGKDALSRDDLGKEEGAEYAANKTVWRLWSANLGGDWFNVRPETLTPDLSDLFDVYIPHRREAERPFTWLDAAKRITYPDVVVEWSLDNGATWAEAQGSITIDESDVQVLFEDDLPPEELMTAGTDAKMRITCVVSGDSQLSFTAIPTAAAVNARPLRQVIHNPQRFRKHSKTAAGGYASVLAGDADVADDSAAIQAYAIGLRDLQGFAELDCEFQLPGIHLAYEIGDQITEIDGREIDLNAASAFSGNQFYPQVIKRQFVYQPHPMTILTLDRPKSLGGVTIEQFEAVNKRSAPSEAV